MKAIKTNPRLKITPLVFSAIAAFALHQSVCAQDIIGVGASTGPTQNTPLNGAGFEFYAPAGVGTTINALGFWDANGTGLLVPHTVSLFRYTGGSPAYQLMATATVPAGTVAPLDSGYRWVGIPTLALPDNGQGGGYYAIVADQVEDTWAALPFSSGQYMNPAIGTVSGFGKLPALTANQNYTVLSSTAAILGDSTAGDGYAGPNLAFLATPAPAQPAAVPVVWTAHGTFTDNTVLGLAGTPANEVYGVDFGGSGSLTTANGYTFNDYAASGNMTLSGSPANFNSFLSGGGTSGDSSFDSVLNNGVYDGTGNGMYGVLQNLTIGQRYNVLVVGADTRTGSPAGAPFAVTDDLGFSPQQAMTFSGGTPALGGYIEGTFTATATSQVFTLAGENFYEGILVEQVFADAVIMVSNTLPASATVGSGSQVVFTAAFSNTPPVNLQWQEVVNGATNNINAGVVNVTNSGVVSSTLTLNNVQAANSGSYRLEAKNATNSTVIVNSALAPLSVIQIIVPNPSNPNLQLWLRADLGVLTNSDGTVNTWTNQSTSSAAVGNADDSVITSGSQGVTGTGPTFVASTINGLPALQFNGGANGMGQGLDILNSATMLAGDSYSLFIVLQADGNWPYPQPGELNTILGNNYNIVFLAGGNTWNGSQYLNSFQMQSNDGYTTIGSSSSLNNATMLMSASSAGSASGQTELFVNGIENDNAVAMNPNGSLGSDWNLGWQWGYVASSAGYGASGRWYNGQIAEILVYQGQLSANDAANINNYLGVKYGVAVPPPTSPILSLTQQGGVFTFNWNGSFQLQSSTDLVHWQNYPGGGSTGVTVAINPAGPAMFFRLSSL